MKNKIINILKSNPLWRFIVWLETCIVRHQNKNLKGGKNDCEDNP